MTIWEIVVLAVPVFFSVTFLTGLVTPMATVPKLRLVGDNVRIGPPLVLKVAVTDLAALMVTEHVPVPVQAPLHPANVEPDAGDAVRVTTVPLLKFALQVLGQLIPLGLLVTFPLPVPASVTVNGKVTMLKVAVTDLAALMVTEHLPVPVQAPPHPAKVEPEAGDAVRVTTVPAEKFAVQVLGQLIPLGLLVTVPDPVPPRVTESAKEPEGTLMKTVSRAESESTQFASALPHAVRLKVTEVMLAPL